MARRFGIDVRALLSVAVPDAGPVELSNKDIAGYLWETLSYFGCDDRVETIVRETAREEGFNDLVYDALVRRIECALEEGGFEVVKRGERGRAMYADAQAGRYTDMEIRVVGRDQSVTVFRAHKCVVSAASPFLRATIEQRRTNMVGAELSDASDTYEIREIPADVFRVCMEFMYTGEVRLDAPMEPGLVAGLVLAADRLLIADDLLPLIGRELVSEASAPRVVEAVYMIHATQAARGLVDMCAMYIVRYLARTDQAGSDARSIVSPLSPLSPMGPLGRMSQGLPLGAIYAVAGTVVNEGHERRYQDDEGDKWMMSVGTAVLACTGMKPWDLQARLIETGTPPNEYAGTYSKTVTFAPVSLGDEGIEMGAVSVGQREYTARVRKSSKSSTTAGSVRITIAFALGSSADDPSLAPQLVTIRVAGRSAHALMTSGHEHDLDVPLSDLDSAGDPSGLVTVEVEVDPLFAICLEVIRLVVQEGPRTAAAVAGLDTRVLLWILCGDFVIASYDAILREIASRPSEEDRVALMKAAVSGFGQMRYNAVSVSEITALLGSVPVLFEAGNERILGMMLSYAVEMCTGRPAGDPVRDQLMGLMECVAQGTRKSVVKPVQNSKRKSDAIS